MKVLMFGWEFPPHVTGGLGVACEGLTRALVEQGLEVTFVAPHAEADHPDTPVTLLSARKLVQRPAEPRAPAHAAGEPPTESRASVEYAAAQPPASITNEDDTPRPRIDVAGAQPQSTATDGAPFHYAAVEVADHAPDEWVIEDHVEISTETLKVLRVNSPLTPYMTAESYEDVLRQVETQRSERVRRPRPEHDVSLDETLASALEETWDAPIGDSAPAPQQSAWEPPGQRVIVETPLSNNATQTPAAQPEIDVQTRVVAPSILQPPPGYGRDLFREVSRLAFLGRKLGESESFDVIHAHDWMTFMAGVEAKLASGKPLVLHVHSTEHDRTAGDPNPDIAGIERYGLRKADRIVVVSRRTRDRIIQDYGIARDRIDVIYNGADNSEPPPPPPKPRRVRKAMPRSPLEKNPKLVLFAGRITAQKGPSIFVEAARQVIAAEPSTRFVLAGAGDQLPAIIELIAKHRLQHHVHITGFLRGPDLASMFRRADLYVMPSIAEPFGLTPLEAARFGVPTIVTSEAGVTEVMPSAVQVPPGDADALATAMLQLIQHPSMADQIAAANREDLQAISWDHAAVELKALYGRLVSGHARLSRVQPPRF